MFKKYKHFILIGAGFAITFTLYIWFIGSPYFEDFKLWSQSNLILFLFILFILKVIGIVWPPIPGGILTLGAVPIVGWQSAYATDFLGSMVGSSIAFYLGKNYGWKFLHKIFDESTITRIKNTKVKKGREIEGVFVLRILTGSTIMEVVCYGAGLLGVTYKNFIIGSALSHLITGVPVYLFVNNLFDASNVIINIILGILAVVILWRLRGRYFE